MAWETYEDTCAGCLPALLDVKTGKRVPDDDEKMIAVMRVWEKMSLAERRAFHRFTCLNSRDPFDMLTIRRMQLSIQKEVARTGEFKCTHCGWNGSFLEGPHGGDAVNFACPQCWARYNDLWPFSIDRNGFVEPHERHAFHGHYIPRVPEK